MCRWMLNELERKSRAVGQLQRVDKAAVAILEILMDDFQLAFELNLLAAGLPLSCSYGVTVVSVRVMREGECGEKQKAGENRTATDPRGPDPFDHVGNVL